MIRSLKLTLNFLFNLMERFFHRPSDQEKEIIHHANLFLPLNEEQLATITRACRLVKYVQGEQILKEGETGGDAVYIVMSGVVSVFSYDVKGVKVQLTKVGKGEYFGEQTLLSEVHKTRSASVEALTDTTLIRIDAESIRSLLRISSPLKAKVDHIGMEQAIQTLESVTGFYNDLESLLFSNTDQKIVEFTKDQIIFNLDDEPDNVYIILQGEVKIFILEKTTHQLTPLILCKGHLFGETSLLNPMARRSATAIAQTTTRLLAIKVEDFRKNVADSHKLQQLIAKLYHAYQIPRQGAVKQFIGTVNGTGPAITSIYELKNKRIVTALTFLNQNLFLMFIENKERGKSYIFKEGENRIELRAANRHLIEIRVEGSYPNLPLLCQSLLNDDLIDDEVFKKFESTGEFERLKKPLPS